MFVFSFTWAASKDTVFCEYIVLPTCKNRSGRLCRQDGLPLAILNINRPRLFHLFQLFLPSSQVFIIIRLTTTSLVSSVIINYNGFDY